MKSMPPAARLYWLGIVLAGFAALVSSQLVPFPARHVPLWELGLFVALGILAGGKKVSLSRTKKDEETGSMSLGFAITFAALIHLGPSSAVVVAVAAAVSSSAYPRRQAWPQFGFNVALSAIEALAGGAAFAALNHWTMQTDPMTTFGAVAGTSITFFVVNTLGVAVMISFFSDENPLRIWKENFLWTAPSYFASACVGSIAVLVSSSSAGGTVLFVLPVAYLVYQSYVTYVGRAEEKQQHIEELKEKQAQLAQLYLATIKTLALAIDAKDQYTHQHIVRVQRYAVAIAEEMGLDEMTLEAVRTGALLHDIGKLGVPEYVLLKPGRLTADEYEKIKQHPSIGAAILEPVEFPWPVIPMVKHHHERWDGTGYPDGLKGEDIPLTARIMAVADVYDAMTSTRSYRQAWTHERTLDMIREDAGRHFDPVVVDAFLRVIDSVVEDMAKEGSGPLAWKDPFRTETVIDPAAQQINRASTELWALYEVAQSLSSSMGLDDTIDLLARKINSIYPGSLCAFLLWNKDSRRLAVRGSFGVNKEYFDGAYAIDERSASVKCLLTRKSTLGEYNHDDLMLQAAAQGDWKPLETAVIIPVYCENEPVGTLNVYHPDKHAFSDYDKQLLELIAERASHAIKNGALFDRARGDSVTDPLTGAFNLRFLTEYVESLCQVAENGHAMKHSVLCLDLDSFKSINDNFGLLKGDSVLRAVANLLKQEVGEDGVVARYGGDEFVVVLTGSGRCQAAKTASRITELIAAYDPELVHLTLGKLKVSASVGYACYPEDGRDGASLISAADQRMYASKTEHRLRLLAPPNAA